VARYGDEEIIVVVRDRELSDAQESGMEFGWFQREVAERTRWCDFEPLVVTATDGDNGGWFRNTSAGGSFWGEFWPAYMQQARSDSAAVRPVFIDDYLDRHGAWGEVTVKTGAWNTGWHHGEGFLQWTGSQAQRDALERIALTSREVHNTRWYAGEQHVSNGETWAELEDAMWHLLRAETSCHLYWGEDWVARCHADLDLSWQALHRARSTL
jgi:hypothetical protein